MSVSLDHDTRGFGDSLDQMEVSIFTAAMTLDTAFMFLLGCVDAGGKVFSRVLVALAADSSHR